MTTQEAIDTIKNWTKNDSVKILSYQKERLREAFGLLHRRGNLHLLLRGEFLINDYFHALLDEIEISENLKSQILENHQQQINQRQTEPLHKYDELDQKIHLAVEFIDIPATLKPTILSNMEDIKQLKKGSNKFSTFTIWSTGIGAIAALLLLFFGLTTLQEASKKELAQLNSTKENYINFLNSKFTLDLMDQDQSKLFKWLEQKKLPYVSQIPSSLKKLPSIGCREIRLDGYDNVAALVCFQLESKEMVHIIIYKKENKKPSKKLQNYQTLASAGERIQSHEEIEGNWLTTHWETDKMNCLMLSQAEKSKFVALF